MYRSPNKRCDSDPDLSTKVGIRKRKHEEDFADIFQNFSETIMSKLDNMKIDFERNMSQIKNDVNDTIKTELKILTEASQEMKKDINGIRKEYSAIRSLVQDTQMKHEELKKEMVSLQHSTQFSADQQDELKNTVGQLSSEVKKVDYFQKQLDDLKTQNAQLNLEINSREQRERLLNIEIVGVPETHNEDLNKIICTIAKKGGVDITSTDIQTANRVSPKVKTPGRPRVIVAKMLTRLLKDNIISGARKHRVTSTDLHIPGNAQQIFINEHLTPYNKQLLKQCKETAKAKEYQYIWVKNGRIFVRKCDTAPHFQITTVEHLKKL